MKSFVYAADVYHRILYRDGDFFMSIRNQILLPVILMAVLLVGASLGVSIWQFSGYVNESVMDETNRGLKGLAAEVDGQKQDALVKAKVLPDIPVWRRRSQPMTPMRS